MAKEITKIIKLQIEAGKATPAPPVGTALGPAGVNIGEFVKRFNADFFRWNFTFFCLFCAFDKVQLISVWSRKGRR